jgi:hypothetical protein
MALSVLGSAGILLCRVLRWQQLGHWKGSEAQYRFMELFSHWLSLKQRANPRQDFFPARHN